ncbi:hypothetical protein LXL04_035786 [Taraxacum kok-saghyz]
MSTTSTYSTSKSQVLCDCGLPSRIRISRTQQNPEKRKQDQNVRFGNGLLKIRLPMNLNELVGLRNEMNDMKKKMGGQKVLLLILLFLYILQLFILNVIRFCNVQF